MSVKSCRDLKTSPKISLLPYVLEHLPVFPLLTTRVSISCSLQMRGLALINSHVIRTAHNSFSRCGINSEERWLLPRQAHLVHRRQTDLPVLDYPVPEYTPSKRRKKEESDADAPFHFVSYVPVNGYVWELDGLKRSPKKIGMFRLLEMRRLSILG